MPDWFTSENQTNQVEKLEDASEIEERRRRLEAIQQKYKKNGGEKGGAD
ncbi:hypothetical protein ACI2OX_08015 [Bacillus sp. N9]